MQVEETVKRILLELLDISEDKIVPEATLIGDLDASSVDLVEVIAAVENEFDIDISDEEAQQLRSVKAVVEFIERKKSAAASG